MRLLHCKGHQGSSATNIQRSPLWSSSPAGAARREAAAMTVRTQEGDVHHRGLFNCTSRQIPIREYSQLHTLPPSESDSGASRGQSRPHGFRVVRLCFLGYPSSELLFNVKI